MALVYIEHEGMLYKGVSRAWPEQVYDYRDRNWHPYKGSTPKPVDWGETISEAAATVMMAEHVDSA